jgi:hypothetical protein
VAGQKITKAYRCFELLYIFTNFSHLQLRIQRVSVRERSSENVLHRILSIFLASHFKHLCFQCSFIFRNGTFSISVKYWLLKETVFANCVRVVFQISEFNRPCFRFSLVHGSRNYFYSHRERCFPPESQVWSEVAGQKVTKAYRYFELLYIFTNSPHLQLRIQRVRVRERSSENVLHRILSIFLASHFKHLRFQRSFIFRNGTVSLLL